MVEDTGGWHLVFLNGSGRLFECTSDSYPEGLLFLRLLHNASACISTGICKRGPHTQSAESWYIVVRLLYLPAQRKMRRDQIDIESQCLQDGPQHKYTICQINALCLERLVSVLEGHLLPSWFWIAQLPGSIMGRTGEGTVHG